MLPQEEIISVLIKNIIRFHTIVEKLPLLFSQVEAHRNEMKREFYLLYDLQKVVDDNDWFNEFWEKYLVLKSEGYDDYMIILNSDAHKFRSALISKSLMEYLNDKTIINKNNDLIYFFDECRIVIPYLTIVFDKLWPDYLQAAQQLFWEKNKPQKTNYQTSLLIDKSKIVNLRMIFLPSSEPLNLLGESNIAYRDLVAYFIYYYKSNKVLPDQLLSLFFKELCQVVKNIMDDEVINRYYGKSFSVSLQVEIRNISKGGIFATLRSNRKGITVTFTPDYKLLMVSLSADFLFDYKSLESTLYHEIIHNLDLGDKLLIDTKGLSLYQLLKAEIITVLLTAIKIEKVNLNFSKENMIGENLKLKPISSQDEFDTLIERCGGSVHALAFLMGLQLLCATLHLGDCRNNPQTLFELVLKSKMRAIASMKIFSLLSPKKLFKYYKRKVPKNAQYFTPEFLDVIIAQL